MTLSYEEFLKDISRFLDLSNSSRDGWDLREIDEVKYLCKKTSLDAPINHFTDGTKFNAITVWAAHIAN